MTSHFPLTTVKIKGQRRTKIETEVCVTSWNAHARSCDTCDVTFKYRSSGERDVQGEISNTYEKNSSNIQQTTKQSITKAAARSVLK